MLSQAFLKHLVGPNRLSYEDLEKLPPGTKCRLYCDRFPYEVVSTGESALGILFEFKKGAEWTIMEMDLLSGEIIIWLYDY